jgi:hypothetical protein
MAELELGTLLEAASNEKIGSNAENLTAFFKEMENIVKMGDMFLGLINKLERSVLFSTAFKTAIKNSGVEVAPLVKEPQGGIIPSSGTHAAILENINKLNQEQLGELLKNIAEVEARKSNVPTSNK